MLCLFRKVAHPPSVTDATGPQQGTIRRSGIRRIIVSAIISFGSLVLLSFCLNPACRYVISEFVSGLIPGIKATEIQPDEKLYFYLYDHLGGIDAVVDENGDIAERRDYLPYGRERLSAGDAKENYGFTGKELDEETGLYYYGARYYDPLIGRFVSQDPWEGDMANPQTLNRYSYVANNPLKYVDTTGKKLELSGNQEFIDQAFSDLQTISPYIENNNNVIAFDYRKALGDVVNASFKNLYGSTLLYKLINDDNTVTVNEFDGYGGNTRVAEHDKGLLKRFNLKNGKGVDVTVKYNPNNPGETWVYQKEKNQAVKKESPAYITLAHELIHSMYRMLGNLNKKDQEEDFYMSLDGSLEMAKIEEIRTVGLDSAQNKQGDITENQIREEQELEPRNHY